MPIRLSGMNSGLDTDAIVSALVSAYSYKKENYTKQQTKLSWKQDAWKTLNTKVYGLYTNISSLRYSSSYNLKKTTSSDTTKASVIADNNATNGSQKLNILQVAQSGYLTGGKLEKGTTTSSTLAELGYVGGDASINVDRGDGTSSTITISSSSTLGDVVNQLKDAGLNASYDVTNNRMFVSAKESGKDADFNLIGADVNGTKALAALGLSTSLYTTDAEGNKVATGVGATYEKYAAFAKVENPDGSVSYMTAKDLDKIESNVKDALEAYKNASEIKTSADAQISNLSTVMSSYANAYAATEVFYKQYGINTGNANLLNRFNNAMVKYASAKDSLIDEKGNVYSPISGKDTDGNAVYAYTDESGNSSYLSKVVSYTDKSGKSYTKNSDGKYVTSGGEAYAGDTSELTEKVSYRKATEKITYDNTTKDENGEEVTTSYSVKTENVDGKDRYYFTKGGKKYVSDTESGDYKLLNADGSVSEDDKITITKNYSYVAGTAPSGTVKTVSESYEDFISDYKISEEDAAAFAANYAKVEAFNKSVTDTESYDLNVGGNNYNYTKASLINEVKSAYAASGSEGIKNLTVDYAQRISELKDISKQNETILEKNKAVSNLAEIEDAKELSNAIKDFANTAVLAGEMLSNNTSGTATKMNGQDAIIRLNDVEYTNASNSITVNGLTINAQAVTGDGDENAITITTETDSQGIYDKIKGFLKEYNELVNEITKLYNAASSKGYEPLTDDEKEAMSDKEIEKWETKIKDSLLRNDDTLNGVLTSMTRAMSSTVEVGGRKYSLGSFGIQTLGVLNAATNEQNAYHIDGDEDDTITSGKKDKLMSMINSDPDTVMSFFQQLTTNLYNELGDKMKSSSLSSVYTIYNDKQMDQQYKEYTSLIKQWEEKISTKEDYYYSKFSSMESALAKLNSTQSSLSGYFG